jgi:hypothetical protein
MAVKDHRLIEDGEERFCAHDTEEWPCSVERVRREVHAELRAAMAADAVREEDLTRIVWTHDTAPTKNTWTGTVNGKPLFSISHAITRHPKGSNVLATRLPWKFAEGRDRGEVETLKRRAEIVLHLFVAKLGAAWVPGEDADA